MQQQCQTLDAVPTEGMPVDPGTFRTAMRAAAAGVVVITSRADGQDHGMTATAFASVCADPATVLIAVNKSARSHRFIEGSGMFCVNFLAEDQGEVSNRFAAALDDQFKGVDVTRVWGDLPAVTGAAGFLACKVVAAHEFGTHTVFFGQVAECQATDGKALVYQNGTYHGLMAQK